MRIIEKPELKSIASTINIEEISDIGCGEKKRFSPSDTKVLSEVDVKAAVATIRVHTDLVSGHDFTKATDLEKIMKVQEFSTYLYAKIKGIGILRGQMVI